ncbi:uncharacterized protein [Amphiura filiformis]|uniref:uncharacterized protein n=1 Tax=Amphiura filiformis TaxID=82378 RepID=UPI003B21FD31
MSRQCANRNITITGSDSIQRAVAKLSWRVSNAVKAHSVLISPNDVSFLVELCQAIQRFDVVQVAQTWHGGCNAAEMQQSRISRFRYLLFDIAINCNSDTLEDIKHLASGYMTINLENVTDPMQLLIAMEKHDVISQDNVSKLHDILCNNQQLINKVKAYEGCSQTYSTDSVPPSSMSAPANQQYLHGNNNNPHLPRNDAGNVTPNQYCQNAVGNPSGYAEPSHCPVQRLENELERLDIGHNTAPRQVCKVNAIGPGTAVLPSLTSSPTAAETDSGTPTAIVPSSADAVMSHPEQCTSPSSSNQNPVPTLPLSPSESPSSASPSASPSATATATEPLAAVTATAHNQQDSETPITSQDDRAAIRAKRASFLDKLEAGDTAAICQDSQPDENGSSDQDTMLDRDAPNTDPDQFDVGPYGSMRGDREMPRYSMSRRGHCLVINNVDFSPSRQPAGKSEEKISKDLKDRNGSDVDAAQLDSLFTSLGYLVTVKNNLSAGDMYELLESFRSKRDHKNYDCFICCILTHGALGVVYGCDGISIEIKDLTGLFVGVKCPSLKGKPKVFFLQACQGRDLQEGVEYDDPNTGVAMIPNETDFLVGYSTVLGYASLRSKTKGTWYISTLVQALDLYHANIDIQNLLALVNEHLGKCSTKKKSKQASMHQSQLTKALFL